MISEYIENLKASLRTEPARHTYFPMNKAERKAQNLKLGREVGYGLAPFPQWDIDSMAGGLFGQLVVMHSLDSVGVVIDNKEWLKAIYEGIEKGRIASLS